MSVVKLTDGMARYRPAGEVMALRVWKLSDHPMLRPSKDPGCMAIKGSPQVVVPGDWLVVGIDWQPIIGMTDKDFTARYVPLDQPSARREKQR